MTDDRQQGPPDSCNSTLSDRQVKDVLGGSVTESLNVASALNNETRYRILLLAEAADGGVCGCELEPHLDVQQSSISQSLSRLWKAGLLSRTKRGRWRYYDTTPLAERLLDVLDTADKAPKQPA